MKNRMGFTTMTFKSQLQMANTSIEALLRWGAENGLGWVEVRDFECDFSSAQLRRIRSLGDSLGLRVHYAWDGASITDAARYEQGILNAASFGPHTCSRTVIAPGWIGPKGKKFGYSAEEIQQLTQILGSHIALAESLGVVLVFENSLEPLLSTPSTHGFERLFETLPGLRMTLDTANPFDASNFTLPARAHELLQFVARWKDRIPYVHLKSSRGQAVVPDLLADGDAPLSTLLEEIDSAALLCIELPDDNSLESGQRRVLAGKNLVQSLL